MARFVPLNALRAFEVAARTGSFANAAREMGVSSAAVSQQVKQLEQFWETTLFIRQGNRIALTDAGQTAYPQLGHSMAILADLSDAMRRAERPRRLVLSAPQSVAETWLAPRLASLGASGLSVPLDIRVENDPIDFARNNIDLRIFYGHDLYGDYRVETLFSDSLVAVASPQCVAAKGRDMAGFSDRDLIHTDWGRDFSSSPNWNKVLAGQRIVDQNVGLRVQASSTALSFARQGFGAALLPRQFAQDDLASGRVVQLGMQPVEMQHDYLIAYRKSLARNRNLRSLVAALAGPTS